MERIAAVSGEERVARAPWIRSVAGKAALAAGCMALGDLLFWEKALGWTVAAFYEALLLMLFASGGPRPRGRLLGAIFTIAALQGLTLALHPTPYRVLLCLLSLGLVALANRHGVCASLGEWLRRAAFALPRGLVVPLEDFSTLWGHRRRAGRRPRGASRLGAWLLALGLGLVFALIFVGVNPVLERWWEAARSGLVRLVRLDLGALRVTFWIALGLAAWSLLRLAVPGAPRAPRLASGVAAWALAPGTLTRCLLVLNLVFLLQNVLDASYLWLGAGLPEGLTYAAYAQRGAYPLLAAALLAAAFVLATFRAGAEGPALATPRRLVLFFLAQNVALTVGALRRLELYVEAYSLTRWRVAAALWMGLVAVGLVLVAVRIARRRANAWLVSRSVAATAALLLALSWLPLPRFIADFNARHAAELGGRGVPIDLAYLATLEPFSLSALERLATQTQDERVRAAAGKRAVLLRARLERDLEVWSGWTLERARLLSAKPPLER